MCLQKNCKPSSRIYLTALVRIQIGFHFADLIFGYPLAEPLIDILWTVLITCSRFWFLNFKCRLPKFLLKKEENFQYAQTTMVWAFCQFDSRNSNMPGLCAGSYYHMIKDLFQFVVPFFQEFSGWKICLALLGKM